MSDKMPEKSHFDGSWMTPCIAPISHSNTPVRRCAPMLAQNWLNPPFTALSRLARNLTGSVTIRLKTDPIRRNMARTRWPAPPASARAPSKTNSSTLWPASTAKVPETAQRRTEDALELLPGPARVSQVGDGQRVPGLGEQPSDDVPGDIELGDLGGKPVVCPLDDLGLLQVREQRVPTGNQVQHGFNQVFRGPLDRLLGDRVPAQDKAEQIITGDRLGLVLDERHDAVAHRGADVGNGAGSRRDHAADGRGAVFCPVGKKAVALDSRAARPAVNGRLAAVGHHGCVAVRLVFKLAMRAVEQMDGWPARLLDGVRDLVCEQGNVGRPFTLREEHVDAPGEGADAQFCGRGRGQRVGMKADRARIHAQTASQAGGHVRRQHVPRTGSGDGTVGGGRQRGWRGSVRRRQTYSRGRETAGFPSQAPSLEAHGMSRGSSSQRPWAR